MTRPAAERYTVPIAAAGTFLALVLFTMPLAQIGTLTHQLGAGTAEQTWIQSSMSVGLTAGMLILGALGDDRGRRTVFVFGTAVIVVGLIVGVVTTEPIVFIVARIVTGIGAAALVACSLGIIGHAHPSGPERIRATAIWGASVGAGIAVGPMLSVGLGTDGAWRTPYIVVAVIASAVGVAALQVPDSRSATRRTIDLPGAGLLGLGTVLFLAGLVTGRSGWLSAPTFGLLIGGAVALVAFAILELAQMRRNRIPLLDLSLFTDRAVVGVTVSGVATGLSIIAVMSFVPVVLLRALDESAWASAGAIAIWSGLSVPVAVLARRIRLSGDIQLPLSLVVVSVGIFAMTGLSTTDSFVRLVPGLVIAGLGSGVLNAALGRQAVSTVPPDRAGIGSGINNTARYFGSAVGVTIVAVIAAASTPQALIDGWDRATIVAGGFGLVGAAIAGACVRHVR